MLCRPIVCGNCDNIELRWMITSRWKSHSTPHSCHKIFCKRTWTFWLNEMLSSIKLFSRKRESMQSMFFFLVRNLYGWGNNAHNILHYSVQNFQYIFYIMFQIHTLFTYCSLDHIYNQNNPGPVILSMIFHCIVWLLY